MVRHGQKTKIKNARKGYTQNRYDRDDGQSASRSLCNGDCQTHLVNLRLWTDVGNLMVDKVILFKFQILPNATKPR